MRVLPALSLALITSAVCFGQPAAPSLRSPEVLPDRRVTFRLAAPKASEVRLTGDVVGSPTPLIKDDKGVWSVTIGPLQPDIYGYNFSVDGISVVDPSNPVRPAGNPSPLEVPGDASMFYDLRTVPHGVVQER